MRGALGWKQARWAAACGWLLLWGRAKVLCALLIASAMVGSGLVIAPASTSAKRAASTAKTSSRLREGLHLELFPCKGNTKQYYTVPSDTHSVYVEAVGGEGMTPDPHDTGWGGLAGQVTGSIAVSENGSSGVKPGDKLPVDVGCHGTSGGGASPYAPGGGKGVGHDRQAFAMSSYGVSGGGGGGASAVLSPSGDPLVVAGGGGGAGGGATWCTKLAYTPPNPGLAPEGAQPQEENEAFWYVCHRPVREQGGNGGAGGKPAQPGTVGKYNQSPPAAGGGTCSEAAKAGLKGADFDALGAGGAGGGGGGGYRGGCGGAAPGDTEIPDPPPSPLTGVAGNGGGGGLSFAKRGSVEHPDLSIADSAGDGYVLFLTGAEDLRTFNYKYTGKPQYKCVPSGTTEIFVDARGGAGAGGGSDFSDVGTGGGGGVVKAVVPVTPGTQLLIYVGQYGHASGGYGEGHGGGRGTASSDAAKSGAGGGGASAIDATTSPCDAKTVSGISHLVVAGGGGGGGGAGFPHSREGGDGGNGGHPPQYGHGGDGSPFDGGGGGNPGANPSCVDCSMNGQRAGGSTTGGGGGGGGGGFYGGGRGHGAPDGDDGGGGGGGGGASYVKAVAPNQVYFATGPNGRFREDGYVKLIVPFPAKRSEVDVVGGTAQSALSGQQFPHRLDGQVLDANGFPIKNVEVDFTALLPDEKPADGYVVFPNGSTTHYKVTSSATDGRFKVPIKAPDRVSSAAPWNTGPFEVEASVPDDQLKPDDRPLKAAEYSLFDAGAPTKVSLSSSTPGHISNRSQPLTITATAATVAQGPYGTPRGSLQFSVDGKDVGSPVALDSSGTAKLELGANSLAQGPRTITAAYLGDQRKVFAPTSGEIVQGVNVDPVSIALSSNAPAARWGTPVQFTSRVMAPNGVPVTPTGSVMFTLDGHDLFRVPLTNGRAVSPEVNNYPVGLHTIGARYSGDNGFLASFQTIHQYVQAPSSTSLSFSHNPVLPYETLRLSATVRSADTAITETPAGVVRFTADGTPVATVPLDKGVATTPPVALGLGYHNIVASYSGENRFSASHASGTAWVLTTAARTTAQQTTANSGKAGAGAPRRRSSQPITKSFTCQGFNNAPSVRFTVPKLTYSMDVEAIGASDFYPSDDHGWGGITSGSVRVQPGEQFTVDPGCLGFFGSPGASAYAPGGGSGPASGFTGPDGGEGFAGFGGGGASALLKGNQPMLVAGGSGGAGGPVRYRDVTKYPGTAGGNGGKPPGNGGTCDAASGPCVGGAGGAESSRSGGPGRPSPCPNPTTYGAAGGGGGGYRGGTGGSWSSCSRTGAAAGGGGGLSYADPDVIKPQFVRGGPREHRQGSITLILHSESDAPTVTLSSAPSKLLFGEKAHFTASLSRPVPQAPTPTGTVKFSDGRIDLGTKKLDTRGVATSDLSGRLPVGPHRMAVDYSGDSVYSPETTSTIVEVYKAPPPTTLSLEPDPLVDGLGGTFMLKLRPVYGKAPRPSGTVQFTVDGVAVGSAESVNSTGTATSGQSEPLSFGDHTITASYSGDDHYEATTTDRHAFARGYSFATLKASYSNPIVSFETLTFTTAVQGTGDASGTPTGTVQFTVDGGHPLAGTDGTTLNQPLPLVNGAVTTPAIDQSKLACGSHTVVAAYSGDNHFQPTSSSYSLYIVNFGCF